MNRLITLAMCAMLLGATWLVTPGCSTPQKTVAYKTLKSVADTVDTAMKAYAEAVAVGAVDQSNIVKISQLHDQYRVVLKKAVVAARFDYTTAAPAELSSLAFELVGAITQYLGRNP